MRDLQEDVLVCRERVIEERTNKDHFCTSNVQKRETPP